MSDVSDACLATTTDVCLWLQHLLDLYFSADAVEAGVSLVAAYWLTTSPQPSPAPAWSSGVLGWAALPTSCFEQMNSRGT